MYTYLFNVFWQRMKRSHDDVEREKKEVKIKISSFDSIWRKGKYIK